MGTVGRLEEHPVEGRRVRVRKTAEGWGRVGKKGVAEQGEDWQEKCCVRQASHQLSLREGNHGDRCSSLGMGQVRKSERGALGK